MLITRILNKLGRTYSDILNFTTTQSEFIPRLAGLVQRNLKAKMLKKPYLFVQFFLTAPKGCFVYCPFLLDLFNLCEALSCYSSVFSVFSAFLITVGILP